MKPQINVTPLIDVLLVLLIIFMVISPLKPSRFEAMIPEEPKDKVDTNPHSLIVTINANTTLSLNGAGNLGTIDKPLLLLEKLGDIFSERTRNNVINENLTRSKDKVSTDRIQKTVFIRAPRDIGYGKVVKLIDVVKSAGANPIGLEIKRLD